MFFFGIFKLRKIFGGGIAYAQRHKHGNKNGKRIQYARKPQFFLGEKQWLNNNQAHKTNGYTKIGGDGVFNALPLNDAHWMM